jgi:hypothetical protein
MKTLKMLLLIMAGFCLLMIQAVKSTVIIKPEIYEENDIYGNYSFTYSINSKIPGGQYLVPLTSDILINTNRNGQQKNFGIAMAKDESFAIVWQDDNKDDGFYQIYAAGFDASGGKKWGDITVNKNSAGQQFDPAIAMAPNGSFVIVWVDDNDENGLYQIYAAGFDASGGKKWGDITVNKKSAGQQVYPDIAMADDGSFVVVWMDDSDENNAFQIYAAGFNSNGSKKWGDITVNKNSAGQQLNPDIDMAGNGSFVVVWEDDNNKNSIYQLYAAGFNANGSKKWNDITVNENSDGQQRNPSVAVGVDGSFVVCWQDDSNQNEVYQIFAAGFNSNSSKRWGDITVNKNSAGQQHSPSVKMSTDGYSYIAWNDKNEDIQCTSFNNLGEKQFEDYKINQTPNTLYNRGPEIAIHNTTNRMAVVWGTSSSAKYHTDIYGRLFNIITKQDQTISFQSLPTKYYGDAAFDLPGTASSGLPVTYNSSNINVATIAENKVTIVGAGSTDITASQPGNDDYNPASSVIQTLTVKKADQIITFNPLSSKNFGDADFYLTGSASSGLPVTYESSNTNVATLAGNKVTIVGAGSTDITALQPGNDNYNPAASITHSLTVMQATLINEISSQKILVYPNPTTGQVFIQSEQVMDYINIYDLQGNKLSHYELNSDSAILDLSQFPSAIYLIRIYCGEKEYSRKIVKKQ